MIDKLLEFYYKYDKFQEAYANEDKARRIYQTLLDRNRLHLCTDNSGKLLGYGESWRISYSTFGRIICGHNIYDELDDIDIETGNIAYLANVTIHPDWRNSYVLRMLRNDFFTRNFSCGPKTPIGPSNRINRLPDPIFWDNLYSIVWNRGRHSQRLPWHYGLCCLLNVFRSLAFSIFQIGHLPFPLLAVYDF